MDAAKTISITLPPTLLEKAQQLAEQEHRTMNQLVSEALSRYVRAQPASLKPKWDDILGRTRAQGAAMGIATEADVERLSDEYRREHHR